MMQDMNEVVLLQKLNALTDAWKALQLSMERNPDIPLQWSIEENILFLDGVWVCPVKFVSLEKLSDHDPYMDEVCMSIALQNGDLDIIVIQEFGEYVIHAIERHIPRSTTF